MAKMTVKEEPVKPPLTITLELNVEEAAVLAKLCGHVCGAGQIRTITDSILLALTSNERISRLSIDIKNGKIGLDAIPIGHWNMPQER
jgi:hypothetical protein